MSVITKKHAGRPTQVVGTLVDFSSITRKNGKMFVEIEMEDVELSGDGFTSSDDSYAFQLLDRVDGVGWFSFRDTLCTVGNYDDAIQALNGKVRIAISYDSREYKDDNGNKQIVEFKNYTPVEVLSSPNLVSDTITLEDALKAIDGLTPAEVLQHRSKLGQYGQEFSIKPKLLEKYGNKVQLGEDGKYHTT